MTTLRLTTEKWASTWLPPEREPFMAKSGGQGVLRCLLHDRAHPESLARLAELERGYSLGKPERSHRVTPRRSACKGSTRKRAKAARRSPSEGAEKQAFRMSVCLS